MSIGRSYQLLDAYLVCPSSMKQNYRIVSAWWQSQWHWTIALHSQTGSGSSALGRLGRNRAVDRRWRPRCYDLARLNKTCCQYSWQTRWAWQAHLAGPVPVFDWHTIYDIYWDSSITSCSPSAVIDNNISRKPIVYQTVRKHATALHVLDLASKLKHPCKNFDYDHHHGNCKCIGTTASIPTPTQDRLFFCSFNIESLLALWNYCPNWINVWNRYIKNGPRVPASSFRWQPRRL